jgi:hypothetical protein
MKVISYGSSSGVILYAEIVLGYFSMTTYRDQLKRCDGFVGYAFLLGGSQHNVEDAWSEW